MRKYLARRALKAFSKRYGYDVSYMEHMLDVSPGAFFHFAALAKLAQHRQAVPEEAAMAAKLIGALAEDCGPCVQLAVDMAREAGVAATQIEAVINRDFPAMGENMRLAVHFAEAVVRRGAEQEEARDAVASHWGEAGVVDLTLAVQVGRLFPMIKAGLGYARTCQRLRLDDRPIDVVKLAS